MTLVTKQWLMAIAENVYRLHNKNIIIVIIESYTVAISSDGIELCQALSQCREDEVMQP